MMKKCVLTVLVAGGAMTASAFGGFGDIIFTDQYTDSIWTLEDPGGANTLVNLYTFPGAGPDFRPGDILELPSGDYAVGNNPFPPQDPSIASLELVTDLFGAPSSSTIASSDPIQFPTGLVWDAPSGQVLAVNNPGSDFVLPNRFEGVLGINPNTGVVTEVYEDPMDGAPRPRYQAGGPIQADPFSDLYFHVSNNGGEYNTGGGGDDSEGSQIYMLDAAAGTVDLLIDLSFVLPDPLTRPGGLVALEGDNAGWRDLYFGEKETSSIYKIRVDDALNYVDIELVIDGIVDPASLDYNPFLEKLVWASPVNDEIYQMNLDGSGLELLATGVKARGFAFIPTPSTALMLGVAGLVARRRR
jgi:hypothetical protein